MANTTDLDAKTDTAPGHGHAVQHGVETGDFDREINLRAILWSGVWLVVVTLAAALLMWWLLRGFQTYDQHHEVKMMPMMAQNPQKAPPGPLLQPENPAEDRNQDMANMRRNEDKLLEHASWVDRPGGTLRVPVAVAIDAIVQRGVAPFPAIGSAPTVTMTQTPLEMRTQVEQKNPADNRKPGATVQSAPAPKAPTAAPPPPAKPPVR